MERSLHNLKCCTYTFWSLPLTCYSLCPCCTCLSSIFAYTSIYSQQGNEKKSDKRLCMQMQSQCNIMIGVWRVLHIDCTWWYICVQYRSGHQHDQEWNNTLCVRWTKFLYLSRSWGFSQLMHPGLAIVSISASLQQTIMLLFTKSESQERATRVAKAKPWRHWQRLLCL
jgi:hypothetical protein